MALLRKKSVNVLKHLRKNVDDLEQIAVLEERDIDVARARIYDLDSKIADHTKEASLARKVANNIRTLLGEDNG